MPVNRRQWLKHFAGLSLGASGLAQAASKPALTTALPSTGQPATAAAALGPWHSALALADGGYALSALDQRWQLTLPSRGHASALHPSAPLAVHCARRPERFFIAYNPLTGEVIKRFSSPEGYHAYGHGAFSADGQYFYSSENHIDSAEGMIGVWRSDTFERVNHYPLGLIGPHEIQLTADGQHLAIAIGGLKTHPDSGREILNRPDMQSRLSYLSLASGKLSQTLSLPPEQQQLSIRHLDCASDGSVVIAMQDQRPSAHTPPLIALHQPNTDTLQQPDPSLRCWGLLRGYIGSVKFSGDGRYVAASSPRANRCTIWQRDTLALVDLFRVNDGCGLSADLSEDNPSGFIITAGDGGLWRYQTRAKRLESLGKLAGYRWDNHIS